MGSLWYDLSGDWTHNLSVSWQTLLCLLLNHWVGLAVSKIGTTEVRMFYSVKSGVVFSPAESTLSFLSIHNFSSLIQNGSVVKFNSDKMLWVPSWLPVCSLHVLSVSLLFHKLCLVLPSHFHHPSIHLTCCWTHHGQCAKHSASLHFWTLPWNLSKWMTPLPLWLCELHHTVASWQFIFLLCLVLFSKRSS